MDVNLKSYPLLDRGYSYWESKDSFVHPEGFRTHVERKLEVLKGELKLKNCEGKPASTTPDAISNTSLKRDRANRATLSLVLRGGWLV